VKHTVLHFSGPLWVREERALRPPVRLSMRRRDLSGPPKSVVPTFRRYATAIGLRIRVAGRIVGRTSRFQSGRGLPHSRTLRGAGSVWEVRPFWSVPVLWCCSSGWPLGWRLPAILRLPCDASRIKGEARGSGDRRAAHRAAPTPAARCSGGSASPNSVRRVGKARRFAPAARRRLCDSNDSPTSDTIGW
jgi:hypothetical protein